MKKSLIQRYILFAAIFVAPLFMLASTPYAFGCDSRYDSNTVQCVPLAQAATTDTPTPTVGATETPTATVTVTATATATLSPTPIPTPKGDSPETARIPMWVKPEYCIEAMCPGAVNAPLLNSPGGWDWIPANSSIWYKMDDGRSLQLQVWVFANGQGGLALDIFAPEQKDLYGSRPIGRGSLNKNFPGSDLFYSGRTTAYGLWYARLTNNNPIPVSFSIRYTRTTPSLNNSCAGCHNSIGYDWSGCLGGAFCQKLHDYSDTNPQCYSHNIDVDLAGGCQ